MVLAVLPFALAITIALTLLLLPVPLFGLLLLDLALASLLSLSLLLLPSFVPLLNLLTPLGPPVTAVPALFLRPGRDRGRRCAPLSRLLGLTLLATLGSLFLTLLLTFGPLLLTLRLLLLALLTTIVTAPLGLSIRAEPSHRDRGGTE